MLQFRPFQIGKLILVQYKLYLDLTVKQILINTYSIRNHLASFKGLFYQLIWIFSGPPRWCWYGYGRESRRGSCDWKIGERRRGGGWRRGDGILSLSQSTSRLIAPTSWSWMKIDQKLYAGPWNRLSKFQFRVRLIKKMIPLFKIGFRTCFLTLKLYLTLLLVVKLQRCLTQIDLYGTNTDLLSCSTFSRKNTPSVKSAILIILCSIIGCFFHFQR